MQSSDERDAATNKSRQKEFHDRICHSTCLESRGHAGRRSDLGLCAKLPHHPTQRSTAQQVAHQGIPENQLSPSAPAQYTVKRGDTLWGISGMYLRQPWRWPELWGMNLSSIANPHLIYPGQVLYLVRSNGYARLSTTAPGGEPGVVRLSPHTRESSLSELALPTLPPHLIEPFLAEPLVVDADTLSQAPRIIATTDKRVLMANGDRAYVRSSGGPLLETGSGKPSSYRLFRDAVPLKNPVTGEILGYEAKYLGSAVVAQGRLRFWAVTASRCRHRPPR